MLELIIIIIITATHAQENKQNSKKKKKKRTVETVSVAVAVGRGLHSEARRRDEEDEDGGSCGAQRVKTEGQFVSIVAPREVRSCGDAAGGGIIIHSIVIDCPVSVCSAKVATVSGVSIPPSSLWAKNTSTWQPVLPNTTWRATATVREKQAWSPPVEPDTPDSGSISAGCRCTNFGSLTVLSVFNPKKTTDGVWGREKKKSDAGSKHVKKGSEY